MIDTIISLCGLGYSFISGIKSGREAKQMLAVQEKQLRTIERLADGIFYNPGIQEVRDTSRTFQRPLTNMAQVRQVLDPVQRALGDTILSSGMISTPSQMKAALYADPWSCFSHVTPLNRPQPPTNRGMVPFLFDSSGERFIGWQTKGALVTLFNCECDLSSSLYGSERAGYAVSQDLRSKNYNEEIGRIYTSAPDIVEVVYNYYQVLLGGYREIPSDPNLCDLSCYRIGHTRPGAQNYHFSITPDAFVQRNGQRHELYHMGGGLYKIHYTEGVGDARIIGHVGSDGTMRPGDHFYAWVAMNPLL